MKRNPPIPATVEVPGGIVTTKQSRLAMLLFTLRCALEGYYASFYGVRRDVVVEDASGAEVYREGPYYQTNVGRAMKRITGEVEGEGLDAWLRRQRVERRQFGPVRVSSNDPIAVWALPAEEWRYIKASLEHHQRTRRTKRQSSRPRSATL